MLAQGHVLDGYRLIRPIGRGGFGEVWLCQLEATGELKALKFISATDADLLERELAALIRYRAVASQLQCPHLVPIEHVNRTDNGLFYTMPLADGMADGNPTASLWTPKTLAAVIEGRKSGAAWLGADEITAIMIPLLGAVQRLSDVGVIHRDIKPENILFISGRPCLGDIGLLADDAATITRRGTPGYAAPSWYLESGGNPDLWGIATTLYTLITGNSPDKLGRAAFLWPPQGEMSVDPVAWGHFHRIILRATHEKASERYLRFETVGAALLDGTNTDDDAGQPDNQHDIGTPSLSPSPAVSRKLLWVMGVVFVIVVIFLLMPAYLQWHVARQNQPFIDQINAQAQKANDHAKEMLEQIRKETEAKSKK